MKNNVTVTGGNLKAVHILSKVGIVLGAIAIVFLILNFIPVAKATEKNVILEKEDILIMAEKGGHIVYPANTRKAFDNVIKNSSYTDIVELDVRTSKDGILVVWEEETINGAALKDEEAEKVYVRNTNVEDLKKYNLGNNFIDQNNKKPYENITSYVSQGLSMLTFEEFIERYLSSRSSVYYLVDIQETGNAGIEAVDKAINLLSHEDYETFRTRVLFSTSDIDVKEHIDEEHSEYLVCGKGKYVNPLINLSKLGFPFLYKSDYELVQVNMKHKALFNFNLAKKPFLRKMEARNMAAIYLNITSEEDVRTLYEIGAHVIASGNPKFIDTTIKAIEKEQKE